MSKKNNFSVALGLTDYVNPILYLITCMTIVLNIDKIMVFPFNVFYIVGAFVSLIFGFSIPTVKLLVGLGKIEFSLPVNLVFFVNFGIFLSGLMLFINIININIYIFILLLFLCFIFLFLVYFRSKKFNNVAVLIGGIGYLLIYISLIVKSFSIGLFVSVIFYFMAIVIYLMLIFIGLCADLTDARVHWVIEISNILCQLLVAVGTIILFHI